MSKTTVPKKRTLFPRIWQIGLALGLLGSYVIGWVDEASSYAALLAIALIATLIPLVLHAVRGQSRLARRTLPLVSFMILLGTIAAFIRVDDFTGNLVPTRISFRWQPRRDELLVRPRRVDQTKQIDLLTTTPDDFPEFLGPGREAFVNASWSSDWTSTGPELVWKKAAFGAGWSGFAAVNGYAVTMEQRGPDELVTCYEIATGDLMWTASSKTRHATVPGGVGPRATPTIEAGRVYTLGATGRLLCLDGVTGGVVWQKDLLSEIGLTPEEDLRLVAWGRSASPLLDEGRVIVPLGGQNGPSLAAYDALTGAELWRQGEHQISYASPMITTLGGVRQIVLVCQNFVVGHDAANGKPLWEYPWPGMSNSTASCSQPVAAGRDRLFLSKGYAHGSALVSVFSDNGTWQAKPIWHRRTVMKTKFTNVLLYQGNVYGLDDSMLACVELETGRTRWKKRAGYGHGQVLRLADKLLVQAESGEVALVALDPIEFRELARFEALDGKTWNNPCVYGPYLLVRNAEQAACYRMPQ